MNAQKSLLTRLGETLDQWRVERRAMVQETTPTGRPRWLRWMGRQMVPNIGTLLMVVVLLLTIPSLAAPLLAPSATSTSTISYQGRLADAEGNPLTDTYPMVFRIYDVPTGGVPLWTEHWDGGNSVKVSDGLFNVMLGSIDNTLAPAIEGHDELYLGIAVSPDSEMEPRVQLGSVPFSMQAMTVPDGSITTAKIASEAITTTHILDEAVTTRKIATGAITTTHVLDRAVTLDKIGLAKYRFWRTGDSVIHYTGPTEQETTLDPSSCSAEEWCCDAANTICYYPRSVQDSVLEFSLEEAPSIACVLLHEEDDAPDKSKGLYYATDGGNQAHLGGPAARLSKEGTSGSPVREDTVYYWLCGW